MMDKQHKDRIDSIILESQKFEENLFIIKNFGLHVEIIFDKAIKNYLVRPLNKND